MDHCVNRIFWFLPSGRAPPTSQQHACPGPLIAGTIRLWYRSGYGSQNVTSSLTLFLAPQCNMITGMLRALPVTIECSLQYTIS